MSLTAWRIVKRRLIKAAFTGDGARRYGGRWNSKGVPLIYTAQHQSLAALEMLAHLDTSELLASYVAIPVEFDEALVARVESAALPEDWRRYPAPGILRAIGDDWALSGKSAVLRVPSVLVTSESNFLLNPRHPEFLKIKIGKPEPFAFDARFSNRR